MEHAAEWTATVYFEEHDRETRARARLDTRDTTLEGTGRARCQPWDQDVPEIGTELAAARALNDLAHQLLDATLSDIEALTHETPVLRS